MRFRLTDAFSTRLGSAIPARTTLYQKESGARNMKKWLSCFSCATDGERNQRCPPEGTLSCGSDIYCSTFPISRPSNSDLNIKHISQWELALKYGRFADAVLVLACPRALLDPNTNGALCELEPVYFNLSAMKMLGLSLSEMSGKETYEFQTDLLNAIRELEPSLLQDAREHLRQFVSNKLPGNGTLQINSRRNPQVGSPQALPNRSNEHAQDTADVSSLPQSAPVTMAASIPRPWKHVVLDIVMYESSGMSTGHANDVAQPSTTMNCSTLLQRPVPQRRRSLLSRVATSQTGMVAKTFYPKDSKCKAPDATTSHGRMVVPAVVLLFQLHLQRPPHPTSYPQSTDTEGLLQKTTGSIWSLSPVSALPTDSSIHGVTDSALLPAPQANVMTFPTPCDSSPYPPTDTGLPDAAACEGGSGRARNEAIMHLGLQQLRRQHSRTFRVLQQHQPSLFQRGGSIIRPAAARWAERYKLAASAASAGGKNGEAATSASTTPAARSGEAGFRAALAAAPAAAEMASATSVTAEEEGSLLETSLLRHCLSSPSKNIADYFRAREGMVLSGLTPVVTAFGGPGCMEVLYQNVTSILYFGLRAQPKTNNGCTVTKAPEDGSSTLTELFSFEPSKLQRLLNDVLTEGRVWRGIVQVPATCHPRLAQLHRAQQTMINPTIDLISSGAPSAAAARCTTAHSSSTVSLIQTATALQCPIPVLSEPPTQQQSDTFPILSVGTQLTKSSPHVQQGSDATIAQALSPKAAAAAAVAAKDHPSSIGIMNSLLPVWPPVATLAVPTPTQTQASSAAEYAGSSIDTYSIILSTTDGLTPATAMATADVDPLRKIIGNSEMDPLATSTWGLIIDAPEQQLTSHEVPRRAATEGISRFMAAVGVQYKPNKANLGAAVAALNPSSRRSICKTSSVFMRERSCGSDANASIMSLLLSPPGTPLPEGCASIGPIVGISVGKRDDAAATADKRQPPPVSLVSQYSHQPSSPRVDDSTTAANNAIYGRAGGNGCPDSSITPASFSTVGRTLSMVDLNQHHRSSCSVGGPRQCHSRTDLGPADFSRRTVPRIVTFASTLRSTPSAAQVALQAAMASSLTVSSRWSVVEPPPPPPLPSASRPFRNPKSWTNGFQEFMKRQEDKGLCIEPSISPHRNCQISSGLLDVGESPATACTATALLDSDKMRIASAGGGSDGIGGSTRPATFGGVLDNGQQDRGYTNEAAAVGSRPVAKARVIDMMNGNRRGNGESKTNNGGRDNDGDICGVTEVTRGYTAETKPRSIPTAASAPPLALQVTTSAGTCWHEICASRTTDPLTGQYALIITQTDVTGKVEAERHLAFVSEAEHRLLEQIFPRHVLAYMTEEGGPWAVPSAPSIYPTLGPTAANPTATASFTETTKAPVMPDTTNGYSRPMFRNVNKLATSHNQVTLLFADIQGFTPMCKVLEPRVIMAFLNDLFTRFDSRLDEFGVYKVETIGDCYFVAGGLICQDEYGMPAVRADSPTDPQHAERVFNFAKAMLEAASGMSLPTTGGPLKMRIGLHSGPVVSGVVGQRMPRFCLFGDTVNTASRMESTGVPGCIHVSEATRSLLGKEDWVPTGGIEVKGKGIMNTYLWTPPDKKSGNASAVAVAAQVATTTAAVVTTAEAAVMEAAAAAAAVASVGIVPFKHIS
ncbi:hypothetical protein VaNZ11_016545 [Volvox africanus]|uniref:Guanylate cyclase domain-containing protein n=1 Tax=Volvox africanus TaxID=51714 RepID=A0ABQ5SMY8_9CHLO|nr:hypothetical protein VaNZ11_016545 [Volvox africanus]